MSTPADGSSRDEVYSGLELRRTTRSLGFEHAVAVKADRRVTNGASHFTVAALTAKALPRCWMRMRSGHALKRDQHYDWALIDVTAGGSWSGCCGSEERAASGRCPAAFGPSARLPSLPQAVDRSYLSRRLRYERWNTGCGSSLSMSRRLRVRGIGQS
ncbi:hypothetical protein ABZ611_30890 [Streptomyces sp. NPDC007861]|uniref:hypothetical protein n=1 Tax=Streptomyces sp. NPDC007861 TaxID=3154893 RepID=UPI0033F38B6C